MTREQMIAHLVLHGCEPWVERITIPPHRSDRIVLRGVNELFGFDEGGCSITSWDNREVTIDGYTPLDSWDFYNNADLRTVMAKLDAGEL